jgi:hypothetical protein
MSQSCIAAPHIKQAHKYAKRQPATYIGSTQFGDDNRIPYAATAAIGKDRTLA